MNLNKIFIVTSEFPPFPGGIGSHAYNLALELSKREYEVTVMADYRSNEIQKEVDFDQKLPFKMIRISRYKNLNKTYLQRIKKFKKFINTESPNIVIASGKFPLWLVGLTSLKGFDKIAVIHGSEVNLNSKISKKLINISLKRFNKVVAVSNYTKSLVEYLRLKKIKVIPNGFNNENFSIIGNSNIKLNGNPSLITIGNVSERKGQHNVIEKLPDLIKKFPKIHYHMVGIPSEQKKIEELALKIGVEKSITFHGMVKQKVLNKILNKSDIFVMLSSQTSSGDVEGFGIALIEANFIGIPTIGSLGCGIEDAIYHNKSGILIDAENSKEFINAIEKILKDYSFFKNNAKNWASNHTWKKITSQYIKFFSE